MTSDSYTRLYLIYAITLSTGVDLKKYRVSKNGNPHGVDI